MAVVAVVAVAVVATKATMTQVHQKKLLASSFFSFCATALSSCLDVSVSVSSYILYKVRVG